MTRAISLDELREQCERELALGVENPEELEDCSCSLWRRLRALRLREQPLELGKPSEHRAEPERFADLLGLKIVPVNWLDDATVALFYEAIRTVFVQESAKAVRRLLALTHEFAHAELPHRSHGQVWYLGLALLVSRDLVSELKPAHIGSFALQRLCPWPVPSWALSLRGQMLRSLLSAEP
jgi:hypothetical protein